MIKAIEQSFLSGAFGTPIVWDSRNEEMFETRFVVRFGVFEALFSSDVFSGDERDALLERLSFWTDAEQRVPLNAAMFNIAAEIASQGFARYWNSARQIETARSFLNDARALLAQAFRAFGVRSRKWLFKNAGDFVVDAADQAVSFFRWYIEEGGEPPVGSEINAFVEQRWKERDPMLAIIISAAKESAYEDNDDQDVPSFSVNDLVSAGFIPAFDGNAAALIRKKDNVAFVASLWNPSRDHKKAWSVRRIIPERSIQPAMFVRLDQLPLATPDEIDVVEAAIADGRATRVFWTDAFGIMRTAAYVGTRTYVFDIGAVRAVRVNFQKGHRAVEFDVSSLMHRQ